MAPASFSHVGAFLLLGFTKLQFTVLRAGYTLEARHSLIGGSVGLGQLWVDSRRSRWGYDRL
jgi:hypothetical protein